VAVNTDVGRVAEVRAVDNVPKVTLHAVVPNNVLVGEAHAVVDADSVATVEEAYVVVVVAVADTGVVVAAADQPVVDDAPCVH